MLINLDYIYVYIFVGVHVILFLSDSVKLWPINFDNENVIKDNSDIIRPMKE
jgi:hypothetical protein